ETTSGGYRSYPFSPAPRPAALPPRGRERPSPDRKSTASRPCSSSGGKTGPMQASGMRTVARVGPRRALRPLELLWFLDLGDGDDFAHAARRIGSFAGFHQDGAGLQRDLLVDKVRQIEVIEPLAAFADARAWQLNRIAAFLRQEVACNGRLAAAVLFYRYLFL